MRLVFTKNGFTRAKSCRLRSRVGRVSMTPAATPAVVPERDGENTSLAAATTSTVSVSVASCSVTGTSVASPSATTTPESDRVPNPLIATSSS